MARDKKPVPEPPKKGKEIRFIGGVHEDKKGWLNASKKAKDKSRAWVIVQEEDEDGTVSEIATWVNMWNIGSPLARPQNNVEAFLQQQPDIDKALSNPCKKMAKCGVLAAELDQDFHVIFLERMEWATKVQQLKGNKAEFRRPTQHASRST